MKVSVLIFTYRPQSECIMSVHANMEHLIKVGHQVTFACYGSALVHRSRNSALSSINRGHEALIFLDDDMLLPSPESLGMLIDDLAAHPVVSGICTTRGTPKDPTAVELALKWWGPGSKMWMDMEYMPQNRIVTPKKDEYFGVGAACLAVRKDAAERLVEQYLSAVDWLEDNRLTFDRLHVRNELRAAEAQRVSFHRRKLYTDDGYIRVFGFPVLDEQFELGEDIGFSMRCKQAGIPIAIDTRITPGHVGDFPYGVWNYVPKLEREKAS